MLYTLKFTGCKIEYNMEDGPLVKHLEVDYLQKLLRKDKHTRMMMPTYSIIAAVDKVRSSESQFVTKILSTSQLAIL